MAHQRRPEVRDADLQGFKYFRRLQPLFERLHPCGTARDQAGNRQLFFDHYAALVLLYFFNPVVTSLRALQQATALDKVQKRLGVRRISLGALSEATGVFDAEPLRDIVQELAGRALPLHQGREAEALRGLTAVDGSLLPALPRMVWALWMDERHRAAKLHLQFDILKAVPCDATITAGASSEPAQLQAMLHAGRLYVLDRGYASYELFRDVLRAGSSLVARIKDTAALGVTAEQTLTAEARAAGVVRDTRLHRLGTLYGADSLRHPLRLVVVRRTKVDGTAEELWLLTDLVDLPAELIALAYRYRWTIELFFRWLKCILGCRHWLSNSANGVAIQVYVALIASLLLVLWTEQKPTKRTWEMLQHYLLGWASAEEVESYLVSQRRKAERGRE
jgi:Transposase DDE domain